MSRSISLPFAFVNGRVATRTDSNDQLTDHVFSVLGTQVGERVMRPAYGADLMQFDFGDGDELERSAMEVEAQRAVATWEPNAVVDEVTFDSRPDSRGNLYATVTYHPSGNAVGVVTQSILVGVLNGGLVTETGAPFNDPTVEGQGSTSAPILANPTDRFFGTVE